MNAIIQPASKGLAEAKNSLLQRACLRASRGAVMACLAKASEPLLAQAIAIRIGCTQASTNAVLDGLYCDIRIDRSGNCPESYLYSIRAEAVRRADSLSFPVAELPVETIELQPIGERRAAQVFDVAENTLIGVFSNGDIEITDSFQTVKLTAAVAEKLRGFLGEEAI